MCIRRFYSGVSFGFPSTRRSVITAPPTTHPSQQQQQPPPSPSTDNLRCYFYYTNERGDLYNVYNTADGFFDTIGTIAKSKQGGGGGPPLSKKQLQTIPSGPSFLKDRTFLDFFMKNLRVFSTDPKVCRDVSRAKRYEECLLMSSSSSSSPNNSNGSGGGVAPLSSPLSVSPTNINNNNNSTTKNSENKKDDGDDEVVDSTHDIVVSAIGDVLAREGLHVHDMFPYVSLCGKELNFIACEKEPIVFYDLTTTSKDDKNNKSSSSSDMVLRFAGTLEEPFVPSSLVVDEEGYLYHPVTTLNTNPPPRQPRRQQQQQSNSNSSDNDDTSSAASKCGVHKQQLGLVGASVGFKLGFEYICEEKDTDGNYVIEWDGAKTPVPLR